LGLSALSTHIKNYSEEAVYVLFVLHVRKQSYIKLKQSDAVQERLVYDEAVATPAYLKQF
jgi:hypothetical protein